MQMILPYTAISKWFVGNRCQTGTIRRHELGRRKVLSTTFQSAGKIHCVSGLLWITRDGDTEDILLRGGENLACQRRTRVIIEALEDGVVEITESPK